MEEEFQKLKKEITTAFQKKPFDVKRGVQVWTNASKEGGLRYMVAQEERERTEDREFKKQVNENREQ